MGILKTYHRKIDRLTLRERRFIALALCSVILALFALLFWNPLWAEYRRMNQENGQYEIQIETSQNSINALELRSKRDVNAPYKEKLKNLILEVQEQRDRINGITSALIQPERMNEVFEGLLMNSPLSFESIKNIPAEKIKINEQDQQALFKHGLKMQLQGRYMNALKYLQNIEAQNWQLYWDELEFATVEYPIGSLRLKVHTISTSNKVLGL
ncbi:MAG: hypothetical protein HWE39_02890 [Oceanospirillaceae bacterium]|nr:hypothetical protein [Oceanospirillaceae bacterium]